MTVTPTDELALAVDHLRSMVAASASFQAAILSAQPAPAAPVLAASATAGGVTAGSHVAAISYVYADGETALSPASNAVVFDGTKLAHVTGGAVPGGVSKVNVYLALAGGATLFCVATVAGPFVGTLAVDAGASDAVLAVTHFSPDTVARVWFGEAPTAALMPFAVVWLQKQLADRIAEGAGSEYENSGILGLQLVAEISDADPADAYTRFLNLLGAIRRDVLQVAGSGPPNLTINALLTKAVYRFDDPNAKARAMDVYIALVEVGYRP